VRNESGVVCRVSNGMRTQGAGVFVALVGSRAQPRMDSSDTLDSDGVLQPGKPYSFADSLQ